MTLHQKRFLTSAAIMLLLVAAFPAPVFGAEAEADAKAEEAPALAARIGDDEIITQEDFERTIEAMRQVARQRGGGQGSPRVLSGEDRLNVLRNIADMKVLYLVAKEAGSSPSDEDLKAKIDEIRGQLPPSLTLEDALKQRGSSVEELSENIRQQLTIQTFVEKQSEAIKITEEEIAKRYEEMKVTPALKRPSETVDVAHILVKVAKDADEETWNEAKKRIDAARERIVTGKEDFAAVASEVSEDTGSLQNGGLYRETPRGRMVPEFDKAAFETPVGEVTEPFRTQFGWHFLTVEAKHEAGVMTLEEANDTISDMIRKEKGRVKLSEIIAKAKQEKFKVEILFKPEPQEPAEDDGAVIIDGAT